MEQGLLDRLKTAVAVDLPTYGGKTPLAQDRILQALDQFDAENGWIAYVARTKALVGQLTRRLRLDFDPIELRSSPRSDTRPLGDSPSVRSLSNYRCANLH